MARQQHRKMAQSASAAVITRREILTRTHAHPPAAGGHPLPLFEQHHAFLATDQPASQFEKPASQSYGSLGAAPVLTQPPP